MSPISRAEQLAPYPGTDERPHLDAVVIALRQFPLTPARPRWPPRARRRGDGAVLDYRHLQRGTFRLRHSTLRAGAPPS